MHVPIYILIPTCSRPDLLQRTLESLAACRIPTGLRQTIVIENGKQNGAAEVVRSSSQRIKASYTFTPVGNKSHALNLALQSIEDGLILFFDDDIRLEPGTLEEYAKAATRLGSNHFFGGPFGVDYEQEPPTWLLEYLPKSAKGWQISDDDQKSSAPITFCGCNWAVFADDLKRVGPFNTDMGPSCAAVGQETEMQVRLRAHGMTPNYIAEAKVWHYVPADRCSIEWAINRAYRTAAGVEMANPQKRCSRLRCLWKNISWRISPQWIFRRIDSQFATDEEARFRAAYKVARRKAMLDMMKT